MNNINFLQSLLDIKSVQFNFQTPFTWTSGWKSPIYCDNRIVLSHPKIRKALKEQMSNSIKERFPNVEVIAGVATAGLPMGALIADYFNLPFIYVRAERKKHGMKKIVEGSFERNANVVVIEDLISTGKSALKAVEILKEHDCNVVATFAMFSYGFSFVQEKFNQQNIPCYSLSNLKELLPNALQQGIIDKEQHNTLLKWLQNPETWNG